MGLAELWAAKMADGLTFYSTLTFRIDSGGTIWGQPPDAGRAAVFLGFDIALQGRNSAVYGDEFQIICNTIGAAPVTNRWASYTWQSADKEKTLRMMPRGLRFEPVPESGRPLLSATITTTRGTAFDDVPFRTITKGFYD